MRLSLEVREQDVTITGPKVWLREARRTVALMFSYYGEHGRIEITKAPNQSRVMRVDFKNAPQAREAFVSMVGEYFGVLSAEFDCEEAITPLQSVRIAA